MTKRGEPLPINGALNRPRTKLGLELSAWMSIVFVTVTVFLVGAAFSIDSIKREKAPVASSFESENAVADKV